MKLPAFQFYPADWRKDPGIQALSRHDQSVWFDILCLMHESEERGVLLLAGKPMPVDALGHILRLDKQEVNQILSTLLTYGVASKREEDGAIYNRRMVRDERLIQIRREAGKKGGNPNLVKQNPKQKQTTQVKQKTTPSSSSSSSSSTTVNNKYTTVETPAIAWSSTGGWEGISGQDREDWREAYPACDIDRQLAVMNQWLKANPSKAKKKLWRRFITNWLQRDQERGGAIKSKPINFAEQKREIAQESSPL